jgi:hypothetical protein
MGIIKLSEFAQQLGHTRIHNSLIVQHSGCRPEGDNQPNLTEVDNTILRPYEFLTHAIITS